MAEKLTWRAVQKQALSVLPYGLLGFLFLIFASPTSKVANLAFYLLVLLPALVSTKGLVKAKGLYSDLSPIFAVIVFWALFSFVEFGSDGWENTAKRFRHALYLIAFISATYYMLSANIISISKLATYLFCLAVGYSLLSFVYFYWVEGRNLSVRLYPILRLDSPIYMAIILTVYGVPLMHWFSEKNKRINALALFVLVVFFLNFYNSRSAIVGLLSGVFAIAFAAQSMTNKKFIIVIITLSFACLVGSYFLGNIFDRGVSYRVDIWVSSLEKSIDCGLFLGCGFGGNSEVTIESGRTFQHSHNLFLSHLVNTGILGLLSLLGLLGYVIYQGVKVRSVMVWGLVVGVIALFFDGNALITNPDALWLIFWLPLVQTYWEINQKKTQTTAVI